VADIGEPPGQLVSGGIDRDKLGELLLLAFDIDHRRPC
jgi:hypothetical protein